MTNEFRAPTFAPLFKRPFISTEVISRSILLVLALAAPFNPADLQTPIRARAVPQSDIPPNTLLLGFPPAPFSQLDWFTPGRARYISTTDNPFNANIQATEISQPLVAGDTATQIFTRKYNQVDQLSNLLLSTLAPSVPVPFYQLDWVNPLRARAVPQADSISGVQTRGIPPLNPFVTVDTAQPAGRKLVRFDDVSRNLLLQSQQSSVPFTVIESWPITYRLRYLGISDPPNLLTTTLKPAAQLPFFQTDWPITYRLKPTHRSDTFYRTLATFTSTVLATPFQQNAWPIPVRARSFAKDESQDNLLLNTLFVPSAAKPFTQSDWLTPNRRISLRFDDSTNQVLLGFPVPIPPTPPVPNYGEQVYLGYRSFQVSYLTGSYQVNYQGVSYSVNYLVGSSTISLPYRSFVIYS